MSVSSALKLVSSNKVFGGLQQVYEHASNELKCNMKFAVYLPHTAQKKRLPVVIWLSGLTCNEQNFISKSGFQKYAAEHELVVVAPDTSPRGCNIEGESDRWDFGVGAGFYVDATEEKWATNFRMYSYINEELHEVIKKNFNNGEDQLDVSICGHSMGGHGALISYLKNPNKYKSASAFAPICNPINCDWGKFAFNGYLGKNEDAWKAYDATCLAQAYKGDACKILIDQGGEDNFLKQNQLLPEAFVKACERNDLVDVNMRLQDGYDHSYYFISTFIRDHFKFHADHLKK